MRFFTGVTDRDWFFQLQAEHADEVNFWKPSAKEDWHLLQPGEPFLFKLKGSPHYIVGGAFFVRYSVMPASVAWAAFGSKNGTRSLEGLKAKIIGHTHRSSPDPQVGCIILTQPFFFEQEAWVPVPAWGNAIVQGKRYLTENADGAAIWAAVTEHLNYANWLDFSEYERYQEQTIMQRVGQGGFRVLVMDAYNRRCAVTGERTLPVLQASHIIPYSEHGKHIVSNGLFLRSDIHTLFDAGYLTVTPDLHVEVSSRIKSEFENGKDYYALQGRELISLPGPDILRPSRESLVWHNEHRFAA
ncbi:MAG: HNH endonuclease [Bacteroidota bacterium]|nr:HNH endonuclease [Bacteroidota bacterium]MDP4234289.1 HNH endonuclease [Bacteroidota bacterium]MDP4243224.1 HNH endonuclease [Bacteroidota bacterium]MDP4288070.1 HNH endonuclease [Bacteroidota bacterium]